MKVNSLYPKPLHHTTPAPDHSPLPDPALDPGILYPAPTELHRTTRVSNPPDRFGFPSCLSAVDVVPIPSSYSHVVKEPCWQNPTDDEIVALETNQT